MLASSVRNDTDERARLSGGFIRVTRTPLVKKDERSLAEISRVRNLSLIVLKFDDQRRQRDSVRRLSRSAVIPLSECKCVFPHI